MRDPEEYWVHVPHVFDRKDRIEQFPLTTMVFSQCTKEAIPE